VRKLLVTLPVLIALSIASAQPNYQVGPFLFAISNRGAVRIGGEGFNLGTGSLMSWGPGWQWVDSCSWQDSWSLVSGPTGSEVEYEVECYARCAFAEFRSKVKYWVGANATLLEANLTVVSDSSFAGMAWTLQIPIERFAGKTIYAIKADGSLVPLKLREQHVSGQAGLFSTDSAVGWLIPATNETGLVIAVVSDIWPQGIMIGVDDEREWAGGTYALRNWLSQQFQLPANQRLRFLVYFLPYSGDPQQAVRKAVDISQALAKGSTLDDVKAAVIGELGIEEARAARVSPTALYAPYAVLAAAAVAVVAVVYTLVRRRA
jgi:hypothetical protein